MIRLSEIAMGAETEREPLYDAGPSPIGMTRGRDTHEVTIRLRFDDAADITRIHAAIKDLTEPKAQCAGAALALPE